MSIAVGSLSILEVFISYIILQSRMPMLRKPAKGRLMKREVRIPVQIIEHRRPSLSLVSSL